MKQIREIKFRGKSIQTGEWVYGSLTQSEIASNGHCVCRIHARFADSDSLTPVEVVPETVGEWTGKKDKNRREIYEGDIVHVIYKKGNEFMGEDANYKDMVYYDTNSAAFFIRRPIGADTLEQGAGSGKHSLEIIGNIHEANLLTPQPTHS